MSWRQLRFLWTFQQLRSNLTIFIIVGVKIKQFSRVKFIAIIRSLNKFRVVHPVDIFKRDCVQFCSKYFLLSRLFRHRSKDLLSFRYRLGTFSIRTLVVAAEIITNNDISFFLLVLLDNFAVNINLAIFTILSENRIVLLIQAMLFSLRIQSSDWFLLNKFRNRFSVLLAARHLACDIRPALRSRTILTKLFWLEKLPCLVLASNCKVWKVVVPGDFRSIFCWLVILYRIFGQSYECLGRTHLLPLKNLVVHRLLHLFQIIYTFVLKRPQGSGKWLRTTQVINRQVYLCNRLVVFLNPILQTWNCQFFQTLLEVVVIHRFMILRSFVPYFRNPGLVYRYLHVFDKGNVGS